MVRCRGIRNVALAPDDNVGLRVEKGATSPRLHKIYLAPQGLLLWKTEETSSSTWSTLAQVAVTAKGLVTMDTVDVSGRDAGR